MRDRWIDAEADRNTPADSPLDTGARNALLAVIAIAVGVLALVILASMHSPGVK